MGRHESASGSTITKREREVDPASGCIYKAGRCVHCGRPKLDRFGSGDYHCPGKALDERFMSPERDPFFDFHPVLSPDGNAPLSLAIFDLLKLLDRPYPSPHTASADYAARRVIEFMTTAGTELLDAAYAIGAPTCMEHHTDSVSVARRRVSRLVRAVRALVVEGRSA